MIIIFFYWDIHIQKNSPLNCTIQWLLVYSYITQNTMSQDIFITLKRNSVPINRCSPRLLLRYLVTTNLLSVSMDFPPWTFYMNEIIHHVYHAVPCINNNPIFIAKYYSIIYTYNILFIHALINKHLFFFFHTGAIMS